MADEEDWEYYDDSTTLSDLWQYLRNECLEDDPVSFWLKTPIKDIQEAIHDYWRLKVPLLMAPTFGHTSVDEPVKAEDIKNSLIHPLEAYICGTSNTRDAFEVGNSCTF